MTDGRDPVSRLESLGAPRVPPPSDELVDGLVASRLPAREERVVAPRHRVRFPVVLPAAALAAAIVGFVLVAVNHDGSSPSPAKSVVLETAVDASVEIDGQSSPARSGAPLQDGAIVTVGPSGSVQIGGVTLGPGERAQIRAGRLQRLARLRALAADWEQLPIGVDLEGRRSANGVVGLVWSAYTGTGGDGYVVFRDGGTRVATRRVAGVRAATDRAAPAGPMRYVVVVVDSQRNPIARSEVLSL